MTLNELSNNPSNVSHLTPRFLLRSKIFVNFVSSLWRTFLTEKIAKNTGDWERYSLYAYQLVLHFMMCYGNERYDGKTKSVPYNPTLPYKLCPIFFLDHGWEINISEVEFNVHHITDL